MVMAKQVRADRRAAIRIHYLHVILDYCVTGDDGNIRCWLNGDSWEDLGVVFTSKGKGDIRGTRFVDINGDGRADWIVSALGLSEDSYPLTNSAVGQRHRRH